MSRKLKERQRKQKFTIPPIIPFLILIFISNFMISPFLQDGFFERQTLKFSSSDRLIFVHSRSAVILLVGIPIAVIFWFFFSLKDKKKRKPLFIKKYIFIGLAIVVVGSFF